MAASLAVIFTCDNCHLDAGTRKFGMSYVGVFADFPQYRAGEGEAQARNTAIATSSTTITTTAPVVAPVNEPQNF